MIRPATTDGHDNLRIYNQTAEEWGSSFSAIVGVSPTKVSSGRRNKALIGPTKRAVEKAGSADPLTTKVGSR